MHSLVDWPRKRTLCFPVFPDTANQPRPEKAVHRESSPKPLETEIQTRVPQDDLVSLSPLSSSQDSSQSETLTVVPTLSSAPHNTQNSSEEKEIEKVVELGSKGGEGGAGYVDKRTGESEAADLLAELLSSQPLVRGDLPRDRESLQELRLQTEMELVWVRQAISSRRKVSVVAMETPCVCSVVSRDSLLYTVSAVERQNKGTVI